MTIAEKIVQAKEDYDAVYDAGKKVEYDAFWDNFQNYGKPMSNLAFRFYLWEDSPYNPKYPFTVQSANTVGQMFYSSNIIDTKVDIDLSRSRVSSNSYAVFCNSKKLRIIRKVIVNELITYSQWFDGCKALEEIRFEGTIASNLDFKDCKKLTLDSLLNILIHLKDFTGTGEEYTHTLTLSQESVDILNEDTPSWIGSMLEIQKKWSLTIV